MRSIVDMSDIIYLVGDDGVLTEAASTGFATEGELQALLAANLDLLPGALVRPDSPRRWLLIEREAGVPNREGGGNWWSLDHLVVDQDAVPTFVEVKRASDTRARREVVAQMLDYAANGSAFWTPEQLRARFEGADPAGAAERLLGWLDSTGSDPDEVVDAFWLAVGTNLREGRIRLVFVADQIPASLQRLVEFLNEQMPRIEVLALEVQQYRVAEGQTGALVPRLVGQTSRAQAVKEASVPTHPRDLPWTEDEVLEQVTHAGGDVLPVAQAVLKWARDRPDVRASGGRGISDRSITMRVDYGLPACFRCMPLRMVEDQRLRSGSSKCLARLRMTVTSGRPGWRRASVLWACRVSRLKMS
jgi:hypothetical protein